MRLKRKSLNRLNYHSKNKRKIQKNILSWYDTFGRHDLPWKNRPIYEIWISEIMLQQTQVKTVIPFFTKFISKYPNLKKLIRADLDEILASWAGLGYYRRAKNIYSACRVIEKKHNSEFPMNYFDIMQLPGIGRTTASAISTFSNNGHYSILDANVRRLLTRLYNISPLRNAESEKTLWHYSEDLLIKSRSSDFIQAYMDLGSTICKSNKPKCGECPLSKLCVTNINNLEKDHHALMKKPKKSIKQEKLWSLVVMDNHDNFYLEKISIGNLWSGLYSSPIFPSKAKLIEWAKSKNLTQFFTKEFCSFQHRLSHINFTIDAFLCNVDEDKKISLIEDNWYNLSNITIGVPKYQNKIIDKFRQG